jgi:catecholate siderophore receptor
MTYGARNSAVIANPATAKAGDKVKIKNDLILSTIKRFSFKPVENGSIYASYATSSNPVGVDGGDGSEGITAAIQNLKPEEVVLLKWVQNGMLE